MKDKVPRKATFWKWPTYVVGFLLLLLVSWCLILTYHPRFALKASESAVVTTEGSAKTENIGSEVKVTYEAKVVKVVPQSKLPPKPTSEGSAKTENIWSEVKVTYESQVVKVVPESTLPPKPKSKHHLDNIIAYGSERFTVDGDIQVVKSEPFKTVTFNMNDDMHLRGPLPTKGTIYDIPSVHFFLEIFDAGN